MSSTAVIVSLGFTALATALASKVAGVLGQSDISDYIRVTGISLAGVTAFGAAVKLLKMLG